MKKQKEIQYKLIKCIDLYMDLHHITEMSAPAAAEVLERASLLQDSDIRRGLPFREILRSGCYGDWAYQIGNTWHIKRSSIKWPEK